MHTCGDIIILISEILYHYHDMENYITIIDISIILHIANAYVRTCAYIRTSTYIYECDLLVTTCIYYCYLIFITDSWWIISGQ